MGPRRAAFLLAAALAGAVTACSAQSPEPGSTRPAGSSVDPASSAEPALAPVTPVPVTPVPVTPVPVVPPAGEAPDRAFAVGVREYEFERGADRPLPVTVWYPATGEPGADPVRDARPAEGRFPLVLFSHGLGARPADYSALLRRWVEAGLVVAAPTYPFTSGAADPPNALDIANQPADASQVITSLLERDELRGRLDPERIAAAGHSAGGITTVGLFTARRDARLRAGVVLAGTDFGGTAFTGPPAPLLFVHGVRDDTVAIGAARAVYQAVPWSRALLSITKGGHLTASADFEVVAGTTTEFLRWSLYGDADAKQRLGGRARRGDVATLDDQL